MLSLDKALHGPPLLSLNSSNHSKVDANVFTQPGPISAVRERKRWVQSGLVGSPRLCPIIRIESSRKRPAYSATNSNEHVTVNLQDATLALFLAARIHGTNSEIKVTAKRRAKMLPRSKRDLMLAIVDSAEPLRLVSRLAEHLD
ncbi:hypothetical protein D9M70_478560 [compost metagenome]